MTERSEAAKAIDAQINVCPEGVSYAEHLHSLRERYEALRESPPWMAGKQFVRSSDLLITPGGATLISYDADGLESGREKIPPWWKAEDFTSLTKPQG